jgi:predicted amidophosphoribosyltransferase
MCRRCPLLSTATPSVCLTCARATLQVPLERCQVCSHPTPAGEPCRNPVCHWDDRNFGQIHAVFLRRGSIDRVLKEFKYDGETGWRPILARFLIGWLQATPIAQTYDLIVANPTHKDRQPIRHTEQIIAGAITEDLLGQWPLDNPDDPTLVKPHETEPSVAGPGTNWHSKKQAADQLWHAVDVRHPERTRGRRVLLFDDITTTCHQLRVVAGLLKRDGHAAGVDCLVLARST